VCNFGLEAVFENLDELIDFGKSVIEGRWGYPNDIWLSPITENPSLGEFFEDGTPMLIGSN
jgi:hypothetical protein